MTYYDLESIYLIPKFCYIIDYKLIFIILYLTDHTFWISIPYTNNFQKK